MTHCAAAALDQARGQSVKTPVKPQQRATYVQKPKEAQIKQTRVATQKQQEKQTPKRADGKQMSKQEVHERKVQEVKEAKQKRMAAAQKQQQAAQQQKAKEAAEKQKQQQTAQEQKVKEAPRAQTKVAAAPERQSEPKSVAVSEAEQRLLDFYKRKGSNASASVCWLIFVGRLRFEEFDCTATGWCVCATWLELYAEHTISVSIPDMAQYLYFTYESVFVFQT